MSVCGAAFHPSTQVSGLGGKARFEVWPFPTSDLGDGAAAGGIALIAAGSGLGGFVAPNVKTWVRQASHPSPARLTLLAVTTSIGAAMIALVGLIDLAGPGGATSQAMDDNP